MTESYIQLVADGLREMYHFLCLPNLKMDVAAPSSKLMVVGVELLYQSTQAGLNRGEKTEGPACVAQLRSR